MNDGYVQKLPGGAEIRVRRCREDVADRYSSLGTRDVIELSIESFIPYWSLVSLTLSPSDAALLACNIFSENTRKLDADA